MLTPVWAASTDTKTVMNATTIEHLSGMEKVVASGPLISTSLNNKHNPLASYKLISLFDNRGNLYDTQLYITASFSDWAYLNKASTSGKIISLTPIKKTLSCKLNPCSYLETVALHFKDFSSLKDKADQSSMFRFKLKGKSAEREYVIPTSYIKGFVQAVDSNQAQIKNLALKTNKPVRMKASLD